MLRHSPPLTVRPIAPQRVALAFRLLAPRFVACTAILFLVGCQTGPRIGSESNAEINLSKYRTYALLPLPNQIENADPGMALRIAGPVQEEIHAGMVRQGYTKTDLENADLVLNVRGRIVPKVNVVDWGYGYGGYQRWGHYYSPTGGVTVDQYEQGTLIIEAFENSTRSLAWVGWAEGRVQETIDEERLRKAIADILSRFPAPATSPDAPPTP